MVELSWNYTSNNIDYYLDFPMMLTAELNHVLSFYPEHMFIPTPLGQALCARITSGGGVSMLATWYNC